MALYIAPRSAVELPQLEHQQFTANDKGWIVTVYNNDYNTYEEVVTILMIATACSMDEAEIETWEVDHLGKSVVHHAAEDECRSVAEIIATIGIRVEVTQE
jgi:ATP-dependent Clp protease adapter protein ClpS